MTTKQIANLIPTMQALALVTENAKVAKKKKKTTGDMVALGMKNLVGVSLIQAESQLIGDL